MQAHVVLEEQRAIRVLNHGKVQLHGQARQHAERVEERTRSLDSNSLCQPVRVLTRVWWWSIVRLDGRHDDLLWRCQPRGFADLSGIPVIIPQRLERPDSRGGTKRVLPSPERPEPPRTAPA